jgi:hypothetical protein
MTNSRQVYFIPFLSRLPSGAFRINNFQKIGIFGNQPCGSAEFCISAWWVFIGFGYMKISCTVKQISQLCFLTNAFIIDPGKNIYN